MAMQVYQYGGRKASGASSIYTSIYAGTLLHLLKVFDQPPAHTPSC
jgi:hypothetical protein